ncbi:mycofactocin-coupled SDR family oxidoreductase [Subtercola endophyticus]|uniref:mycofactocin-coupled SDR family oxidoreductase n=1 Tax=Subtercola endophyticus TaxID=2895559 RepID=UPI001E64FD1D|nr:mycofactocin-coupled SDR family oxidoreductase [Subtercola endophyticus]UFS58326.1 mycofactocin-coupled SDR family oxidoreductase [Subtercola endophyticus]
MGKLDGKVAFITGAGRGQGRSHAIRLAQEGADIIAVDIAAPIASVPYPLSTPEDLAETVRLVEALDRRIYARQADVRDKPALKAVYEAGVAELGPVDIVLPNAGIIHHGVKDFSPEEIFRDVIDVNLVGVWNTISLIAPDMVARDAGGAIVLTSSTQGSSGRGGDGSPAGLGYAAAKHGVVGLMRTYANWLSPHNIRVNAVHPTGVATGMILNDALGRWMEENPAGVASAANLMPIGMVDPVDISNAILFLVSDDGRYVTGISLPVDAGFSVK